MLLLTNRNCDRWNNGKVGYNQIDISTILPPASLDRVTINVFKNWQFGFDIRETEDRNTW